jgi:putative transposase
MHFIILSGDSRLRLTLRGSTHYGTCDFFRVQTLLLETLHVFFVIKHTNREVLHVAVTRHPTAEWLAQQILESCARDRRPPRFMVHDRDSRYGPSVNRRLKRLGIKQVRTPFRRPTANAVAERWVKSAQTDCLDHLFVFNESTLRRAISSYETYYNHHRPHRSIGQRAPCASGRAADRPPGIQRSVIAEPILGGLHHIYRHAS